MSKVIIATWAEYGAVSDVRPPSYRLRSGFGLLPVTTVAPVLTPADPDWKSKVGSLEWQISTESFNRNVGWKIAYWHWSVVENGRVLGAGNIATCEAAREAAQAALPLRIRRFLSVLADTVL